jgi:hypothetical protein
MSFEGRQFAEQGYSSGRYQYHDSLTTGGDDGSGDSDDEDIPGWAARLFTTPPSIAEIGGQQLDLSPSSTSTTKIIQIKNEERSWEQFYAKIIVTNVDGSVILSCEHANDTASEDIRPILENIQIQPAKGTLAPRGSGNSSSSLGNNKFSDTVDIQITGTISASSLLDKKIWLRVGTESESWTYLLG